MTTVSGFVALVGAVERYFDANGIDAKVAGGWKQREQILNQGIGGANRVIFVPGRLDPTVGAPRPLEAGKIVQPRIKQLSGGGDMVGGSTSGRYVDNPRPLRGWEPIVSVSVWGVDNDHLDDELAQIAATVDLFEKMIQAVHNGVFADESGLESPVGLADVVWEGSTWGVFSPNAQYGRELIGYFVHKGPFYDVALGVATPKPAVHRVPAS